MEAPPTSLRRGYLSDAVFAAVGAEILRGVYPPGAPVPAERLLSARFGVSKLLVRQALHRLAEAGLVEVRQGGATRVADVSLLGGLQAIELFYRLAPDADLTRGFARDVLEKQYTQGLSLVALFALRASEADRDGLVALAAAPCRTEAQLSDYEERLWTHVGAAVNNRIFAAELRWWYRSLDARPAMASPPSVAARVAFYRGLARRLSVPDDGGAAIAFYQAALVERIRALAPRKGAPGAPSRRRAPR